MKDPRDFVYRVLLLRLLAVAVLLIAVVMVSIYFTMRNDVGELVLDRARIEADRFATMIRPILDAPGAPDKQAINDYWAQFIAPTPAAPSALGTFTFARIRTPQGDTLAALDDPGTANRQAFNAWLDEPWPDDAADEQVEVARINGEPFLRVRAPLMRSDGSTAAHAHAIFDLSDEVIEEVQGRLLRAAVACAMLILAVTLLLYPVIVRFLRRVLRLSMQLLDANLGMVRLLGSAIAQKDADTDIHNYRVTLYSIALGEQLKLDDPTMRRLIKGAFLHDIGKLGVPDAVLKKPGPLEDDEREEMRRHVTYGLDIVSRLAWLEEAAEVIGNHHERYDGNGYHTGLQGEQIPVTARVFAVADVFDALMSRRPYKDPMSFSEAVEAMNESRGTHFDPAILDTFLEMAQELHQRIGAQETAELADQLRRKTNQYFRADLMAVI